MKEKTILIITLGILALGIAAPTNAYQVNDNTVLLIESETFQGDQTFTDSSFFGNTINTSGNVIHSTSNATHFPRVGTSIFADFLRR